LLADFVRLKSLLNCAVISNTCTSTSYPSGWFNEAESACAVRVAFLISLMFQQKSKKESPAIQLFRDEIIKIFFSDYGTCSISSLNGIKNFDSRQCKKICPYLSPSIFVEIVVFDGNGNPGFKSLIQCLDAIRRQKHQSLMIL